jgi:hypothetical protein
MHDGQPGSIGISHDLELEIPLKRRAGFRYGVPASPNRLPDPPPPARIRLRFRTNWLALALSRAILRTANIKRCQICRSSSRSWAMQRFHVRTWSACTACTVCTRP